MTDKVRAILTELRRQLQALYGPRLQTVILYGSQARGDADAGSDIDVLVVLQGPVSPGEEIERTSGIVSELSLRHNEVISCIYMDADHYTHRHGPLPRNIRREGVAV
ncbi:MAG TPA: nucleotidyltransferase domain-containing protein [Chloroflexota bacterium]|nr:nucleotidyltransferase domain-containing protein [Chloroflexota bacterium]